MINIYEAVASNKRRSTLIVVLFFIFTSIVFYILSQAIGIYMGYEPGGLGFLGIAIIISGFISFSSYYYSDKIVLKISNARLADRKNYFDFYTVSENLSIGAGLPKPALYIIEDSAPNAFATGRDPDHAVICATTGLLSKLNRTELEGVLAHELTHIKNYDVRLMSVVSVLVGSIALITDWFLRMNFRGRRDNGEKSQIAVVFLILGMVLALLSPIIAHLIQLAISRSREFSADAGSVLVTKQPQGLINALKIIANDHEPLEAANKATAHLYIENPFKDKNISAVFRFSRYFNTHPPVEERIKALEKML